MNIGFISLGCSKNRVDTEIMMALLKKAGHKITDSVEKADMVIVNTCGFITAAKEEAIETLIETGKLKEYGSLKFLLAAGCLSQRYGQDLLDEMPELDGVFGIANFVDVVEIINRIANGERVILVDPAPAVFLEQGPRIITTPTGSAYLKITEGCNNQCSYCSIPGIRGRLRSKQIDDVLAEAQRLVDQGTKELVLIGQDTAAYGRDLGFKYNLCELLEVLCQVDGLEWIRLMYLHPAHLESSIINTVNKQKKVLPYLDIPIQHVSDKILSGMNRKHNKKYLQDIISHIKKDIAEVVLRTTVMVGFPGENEEEFQELVDFIEETEFDWLGAFAYCPEENTKAAVMDNQIEEAVKERRRESILALQKKITRKKNIARIGSTQKILVSRQVSKNLYIGRGYFQAPEVDGITIIRAEQKLAKGNFVEVLFKGVRDYDMIGDLNNESTQ